MNSSLRPPLPLVAMQVLAELRRLQPKAVIFTTVPIAGSYHRSAAPGMPACMGPAPPTWAS